MNALSLFAFRSTRYNDPDMWRFPSDISLGSRFMSTKQMSWTGLFAILSGAWLTAGLLPAADQPDARKLVEQAIAAQGGVKALESIKASWIASKGQLNELGEATFHAETFAQSPNHYRLVMSIETDGNRIHYVDVLNGDRAWNRVEDMVEEVTGPTLTEMRVQEYVNSVASLLPLIRDEGYTLGTEAQQKIDSAPANVVVVRKKGQPDVRLSFDVQSHLLVKIEHTRFDPTPGKNARFEEFPKDYRLVDLKAPDRKILETAKIGADAKALKAYLRNQTLAPSDQQQAKSHIKSLGDEVFAARESAKTSLIKMGPRVIPLLEQEMNSTDPEIATRARECLQSLGKGPGPELLSAAVRAFSYQTDPEALDVLLAYLPCAGDSVVAQEVRAGLAALVANDSRAKGRLLVAGETGDPVLRKALAPVIEFAKNKGEISFRVYPEGVKQAMKGMKLKDGKKMANWESTEIRFFNSVPSTLFGKP
jgi:hypothetical protein